MDTFQHHTGNGDTPQQQDPHERIVASEKSRHEKPTAYPERHIVPDDKADWSVPYPDYTPPYFVTDRVLSNDITINPTGYADPEDISLVTRTLQSYEGDVKFDDRGLPLNPYTRTGIEGRGSLGKWGANFAADPIITRVNPQSNSFEIAMIRRKDNGELAIPGGMVDAGEDVSQTIEREFKEEAGAVVTMSEAKLIYQGYVDDPRNTDNAWMETTVKHLHLDEHLARVIQLTAGSDAQSVAWLVVNPENIANLYASHSQFIRQAVQRFYTEGVRLQERFEDTSSMNDEDLGDADDWTDARSPTWQDLTESGRDFRKFFGTTPGRYSAADGKELLESLERVLLPPISK